MDRFPATHARHGPSQTQGYYPLTELHTSYPQNQYDSWLENPGKPDPLSKDPAAITKPPSAVRSWWWEITAMCISIASAVAIIAVLLSVHDKALSQWKFLIAPNALISIFSTLSKAAMLGSVASCIGQLKWAYFRSSRRSLYDLRIFDDASRGPWGSIVFLWRIKFRSALASCGSIVSILALAMDPFTQQILAFQTRNVVSSQVAGFGYAQVYDSGANQGLTGPAQDIQLDPRMQGAIFSGLYNIASPAPVDCPAVVCQWRLVTTLAVCSTCRNATKETVIKCKTGDEASTYCNYTTPAGFKLNASSWSSGSGYHSQPFTSASRLGPLDWLFNSTIVSFATQNWTTGYADRPDVTECEMRLCARTFYNATTVNGTFVPGTTRDWDLIPDNATMTPVNQSINYFDYKIDETKERYTLGNASFVINERDHNNLNNVLGQFFTSTYSDNYGLTLMRSGNINDVVQNISTSMTNAFGRSPTAKFALGWTLTKEVYIKVHWAWLALPILNVLIAAILLVATVTYTTRMSIAPWKSSILAPLLARLDPPLTVGTEYSSFRAVENDVKALNVVLHGQGSQDPIFSWQPGPGKGL